MATMTLIDPVSDYRAYRQLGYDVKKKLHYLTPEKYVSRQVEYYQNKLWLYNYIVYLKGWEEWTTVLERESTMSTKQLHGLMSLLEQ